jgi:hypothetical protein
MATEKKITDENKDNHIIWFFSKRKIRGVTANDDYFKYVDLSHLKYIGEDGLLAKIFVENFTGLTKIEKDIVLRDVFFMCSSNLNGIISVDWDRFFELSQKRFIKAAHDTADALSKRYPSLPKKWDTLLKQYAEKQDPYQ